jgi:hypothetical protein
MRNQEEEEEGMCHIGSSHVGLVINDHVILFAALLLLHSRVAGHLTVPLSK